MCLTRGGCVIGQVAAPDDVVKNRAATKRGRHLNAHIARERLGVRASLQEERRGRMSQRMWESDRHLSTRASLILTDAVIAIEWDSKPDVGTLARVASCGCRKEG